MKRNGQQLLMRLAAVLLLCLTVGLVTGASAASKIRGYVVSSSIANIREEADATSDKIGQLPARQTVPYYATKEVSGRTWYQIVYNGTKGWVYGKNFKETTKPTATPKVTAAPKAVTATPRVTATPKPTKVPTSKRQGYVRLTAKTAMYSDTSTKSTKLDTVPAKQELPYYASYPANKPSWYYVKYNGQYGWVSAKNLKLIDATTKPATATPKPTNTPKTTNTPKPTDDPYLVSDGRTSMHIYPAETIDWFTGGIQQLVRRNASFKIYDVKTGKIWSAHYEVGTNHADVEPSTAADTAVLCRIYGVSSADEILSKNLWQRRPCLVTFGKHTYACSLYGIPHGTSTIKNNNMSGSVCLHFTNSKTHGTKKVDAGHQAAIRYAYTHAPNGQKK